MVLVYCHLALLAVLLPVAIPVAVHAYRDPARTTPNPADWSL